MEIFSASTRPTAEEYLRHAREADVLVGFIARLYGWIPKGSDVSISDEPYNTDCSTAFIGRSM
jgi:hypothetical protein